MKGIADAATALMRKTCKGFDASTSYLLTFVARLHEKMVAEEPKEVMCALQQEVDKLQFLKVMTSEQKTLMEINQPTVILFLLSLLEKLYNLSLWHDKTSPLKQGIVLFSSVTGYMPLLDLYAHNFSKIPSDVGEYTCILFEHMKQLFWLFSYKLEPLLANRLQDYQLVLPRMIQILRSMIQVSASAGFQHQKYPEKLHNLGNFISRIITIISKCVSRLRDFPDMIPPKLTSELIDVIFELFDMKVTFESNYQRKTSIKNVPKIFNTWMFRLIRLIDVLFTYQKDNFVRSNLELRIKNKLYNDQEQRFEFTVTYQQLAAHIIEPDMYESPQNLIYVLRNLFEVFEDNPEAFKKLQDSYKKAMMKKKEGEEEEEGQAKEEPPQEDAKEPESKEAEGQENAEAQEEEAQAEDAEGQEEEKQKKPRKKPEEKKDKKKPEEKKEPEPVASVEKLKLKDNTKFNICSSNVLKLSTSQRAIIDHILKSIQDRLLHNIQKSKAAAAASKDKQPASSESELFVIQYNVMMKILEVLMRKYPITIPYVLESRLQVPDIAIIRKDYDALPYIDYLIVMNSFATYKLTSRLYTIATNSYCFVEEAPSRYIKSSVVNARSIFDRSILWAKKLAERKDFFENEAAYSMFDGIVMHLNFMLGYKAISAALKPEQISSALSLTVTMFKKAQNMQELARLQDIEIIELMKAALAMQMQLNYKKITYKDPDTAEQYIQYFLNKNFLAYFDKEKREALEKAYQVDFQQIYQAIPANSKQNNYKICPVTYADGLNLSQTVNSAMNSSLLQSGQAKPKSFTPEELRYMYLAKAMGHEFIQKQPSVLKYKFEKCLDAKLYKTHIINLKHHETSYKQKAIEVHKFYKFLATEKAKQFKKIENSKEVYKHLLKEFERKQAIAVPSVAEAQALFNPINRPDK